MKTETPADTTANADAPQAEETPTGDAHPWPGVPQGSLPESSPPFRSVGFTISTIGFSVAQGFKDELAPLGLEPREFALVRAVAAAEGQTQQAIAERLRIPSSRMVAFIDGLEGRGLIERRLDPSDRRARRLHLTSAGREMLERAFAVAVGYERRLCAQLSDGERDQLLDLLERVAGELGLAPGVHAAHSALSAE